MRDRGRARDGATSKQAGTVQAAVSELQPLDVTEDAGGPAIINAPLTTIVVPPGAVARVPATGGVLVDRRRTASTATRMSRANKRARTNTRPAMDGVRLGRARQPLRGDRTVDDEHARAHRPLGRAQHGPRLLVRDLHRRPRAARLWPRASRCTSSRANLMTRAMVELHPELRRGRRVPAQLALPRQHPRGRPHDPRPRVRRARRPPVHGTSKGASGRLRQRGANDVCGRCARRLRGGRADLPVRPGPA